MGQITSLFVHKVVRQAGDSLDRRALFESVGVDPDAAVDPRIMVPDTDYYALFETIARSEPASLDLPLRVGGTMQCDDYGAFGLAWKSAVNLRGSYERAERYARLLTSVASYQVEEGDGGAYMRLHRDGERHLGLRLSNEATIASLVTISQEVCTTAFRPLAVYFRHGAPGSAVAHERHFGCPLHFGSDRDALLVPRELLQRPNRLGDATIARFFDTHLVSELSETDDDASLEHRVRIEVSQALSNGVPKISDIASGLGLSGRTLQRRLSEQGYSFQQLVDAARRELAERLLKDTDYPLAEVAFLTGFSEQSALNRAFKRWAGQTPRSYRVRLRSAG